MSEIKPANSEKDRCPICRAPLHLLRVSTAAKMADVSAKTIYRYVEEGNLYALRIAGRTLRICKGCLLKPYSDE